MQPISNAWKKAGLSALFGLSIAGLTFTPALADRSYTRCDTYSCYRVLCDDDGDNCHRIYNPTGYYDNNYYNNYYRHDYDRGNYRHWVCDSDGDRCHWSYYRSYENDEDDE
ncbi:MAG: hypothetical protein KGJ78_11735 [Alphaproteobacteria bacterium]|nr:hypothetical protein [Alphaproteobacteria bacterium]